MRKLFGFEREYPRDTFNSCARYMYMYSCIFGYTQVQYSMNYWAVDRPGAKRLSPREGCVFDENFLMLWRTRRASSSQVDKKFNSKRTFAFFFFIFYFRCQCWLSLLRARSLVLSLSLNRWYWQIRHLLRNRVRFVFYFFLTPFNKFKEKLSRLREFLVDVMNQPSIWMGSEKEKKYRIQLRRRNGATNKNRNLSSHLFVFIKCCIAQAAFFHFFFCILIIRKSATCSTFM